MYPVTQEFQEKIKANIRKVYGKVQIDYTAPFLDQSIEVAANENANVSFPTQTADAVPEPFAKIASLDGSWVLDGTYALAPTPEESETKQMGWWGKQLAGTGGAFTTPYPTLTVSFFPRPITRLQAVGDSKRQEWPVDFSIRLYDSNSILLHTETVTGNTEIAWSKTLAEPVTQVEKMTLEITKWSHEGRQAKILEFFTSIQGVYEGDDILLVHLLEEREVSQGSLPVGNISANEIDIRLNNETRKFDAGNRQSPLYQTLKANRRIKAWLGVDTAEGKEYVPLGTFWSGDWNVPEDEVYAATTGRDRLELLRKSTYSTSEVMMPDKALNFDGVDDYIELSQPLNIFNSSFTVEIGIFYTTTSRAILLGDYGLTGGINVNFEITADNRLRLYWNGSPDLYGDKRIPINQWCDIAFVRNKAINKVDSYVDGDIDMDYSETLTDKIATIPHRIGRDARTGVTAFEGKIKYVRIWNTARTQQQIQENMHKELTGNEPDLVAYYKLNEGTGTIAHDCSPNANHGTIYGATWVDREPPTLYDLAMNILTDAGLTEEEYFIDPELQQFPVPYAYFDSQSHREALRKIAEACLGQVYCDRNGIIRIEGPSFLQSQTELVATITQDDYFRKDNPVKWSEIANYVEVETQPLRPDATQEVYRSNEPVSINAGQTKTITAYYNHTPCIDATATLENAVTGATITKATYYAWGADISVSSTNTGTFELVINARPLKVLNKEKAIAKDDASILDNGMLKYTFPANSLIQTREVAQKIADTLLAYFKNPRRDVEVEWRGNPALLLGDRVAVVDKDEENEYFVTRQEIEFDGALRAKMAGRRA